MLTGSVFAKEDVTAGRKQRVSKSLGNDAKFLDINLVELGISNFGNLAYDNDAGGYQGLYYPKGQRWGSVLYTGGLWLVGDVNGDIRSASCQYSTEFQPGMILSSGIADDPTSDAYEVFKFDANNPPTAEAIAQGCPAEVLGDQMLYSVYNDLGTHSYLNNTNPLGVEVQQTTWGYSAEGALNNVAFIRFRVINKGGNQINNAYCAIFYDPDLGDSNDDASGADSTNGFGFVYNGDAYDDAYGVQVPAMASDFFQGPIVDAPGETAVLNDGTVLADKRIMYQTSVFHFINGGPIPAMQDPHTAEAQYYFCQGLLSNGQPLVDPGTGLPTKFWFAGDPVTGEGWNYSDFMSPMDVRFGNSTGPFNIAPGDTQDIVLALVCGMGADNLSSITVMRYYDQFAQKLYDANFTALPAPPQPIVTGHPLDGKIVLDWDITAGTYEKDGYLFEGYNVWQGQSISGPWRKLATYDVVNGITEIWDFQYSTDLGALIEIPVIKGSDEGLANTITITKDEFTQGPLINGKTYYFAVTAYAYNPAELPKVYENSKVGVEVVPSRPVLDVEYTQTAGTEIDAVLGGPQTTPTWGKAVVVDPGKLTGHQYRVDFTEADGDYFWDLTDVTTGEVKLQNQTNFSGDDFYNVVDGAKFIVRGILPSDYGWDNSMGRYGEGWDYSGDRWITGTNWGGHALFGGMDLGEIFWGSTGVGPTEYVNVRVDYWTPASHTADPVAHPWSNASTYLRPGYGFNGVGVFPGAAYDVEDEANPRRLNLCFVEYDAVDAFWDPILGQREYLFIMLSDYLEDPSTLYNDDNNGLDADALFALWAAQRGSMTYADFSLYMYVMHPLVVGENYLTYDTQGWEPEKSADVAKKRLDDINVFPNPYFAHNSAEGSFYSQFVTFNNLPEDNCDIRIFSLNGELVKTITHTNGTPFERWFLMNEEEVPVASGMYFVHIDTEFGNVILKLAVVNRGAFFRNL
jgi:hypothetical protein